jgi:hypothetical protein
MEVQQQTPVMKVQQRRSTQKIVPIPKYHVARKMFPREAGPYDSSSWEIGQFFPESSRSRIEGAVRYNRRKYGAPKSIEGRIFEAVAIGELIPENLVISAWKHFLPGGDGFAVIFGLPVDPEIAEVVHIALSLKFGLPFNYKEQNGGDIVMKLIPQKTSAANTNSTTGEFGFHSDDALVDPDIRTKLIALYGVINPPHAWTYYAPLNPVWKNLPSEVINILCAPRFQVRMPISFGRGDDIWSEPRPVFFVRGNAERCIAMATYAVRVANQNDKEAKAALDRIIMAFNQCQNAISLDPGVFLIFDNDRGLHKRTALLGDRLVLRTYIRPDLNVLRSRSNTTGFIFSLDELGL